MPPQTFEVKAPNGRTVEIVGDRLPTEAELHEIFKQAGVEIGTAPDFTTSNATDDAGNPVVAPSMASQAAGVVKDVAIGAVKGAGQTATNLGRAVNSVTQPIGNYLGGKASEKLYGTVSPPVNQTPSFDAADAIVTPTNTAQRVGKGLEQIAEVVAPTGQISRATAGMRLLPRMATEAALNAGMSAAQGGDPTTAAVVGGAVPLLGQLARNVPATLKESAEKKITQALGATKERFKAIARKRAGEILRRGLGGSRESLQGEAHAAVKALGSQIDDAIVKYGQREIGTAPILDALETAKDAFRTVRTMPLQVAIKNGVVTIESSGRAVVKAPGARIVGNDVEVPVVFDHRPIVQLEQLKQVISDLGDKASVEHLVAVRRAWDKVVAQAGGFAHRAGGAIGVPLQEQTEAWAKREATNAIRKELAADVPQLAKLNQEFAFWKDLDDVLTQTIQRTQPQSKGLGRIAAEGVGQVVGAAAGLHAGGTTEAVAGAILTGKLAEAAHAAFTSPRWKFVDAKLRNRLAEALSSRSTLLVRDVLGRITAVEGSKLPAAVRER
jgi:hypothetical protein